MNELENIVKSVVYGGIGAAATLVEKGGDIARALVEKGQETVRANQDTVDQIKESAQGTLDQLKETAEDLKRRVREFCERFMNDDVIDASCLTREQRDAVRRQLDEQDALDAEAEAACCYDEPEVAVPTMVVEEDAAEDIPEQKSVPTMDIPSDSGISDDDVPVFVPETPTYSVPDEE